MATITEYLNSQKQDSSYANRAKLAAQYGIKNYAGTAAQNTRLLGLLQAPKASPLAGAGTSATGSVAASTPTAPNFVGARSSTPADPNGLFSVSRPGSSTATTNAPGFQVPSAMGSLGGGSSSAMGGINGFKLDKSTPSAMTPTVGGEGINQWLQNSSAPIQTPNVPLEIPSTAIDRTSRVSLPEAPQPSPLPSLSDYLKSTGTGTPSAAPTSALSTEYDNIGNQILSGMEKLGTKDAQKAAYEKQAGLPEYQKQLNDINSQLATLAATALAGQLDAQGKPIANTFINRQVDAIEREKTVKALGLSAIASTLQGNIALANDTVSRALDAEFSPITAKIDYLKTALDMNKDKMTRAEKKQSDEQAIKLKEYELQVDAQKEAKKNIYSVALEAAKNGADAVTLNGILTAKTPEEAMAKSGTSLSSSSTAGNKLLTVAEAQALGVPYGTTQAQAFGMSAQGKPTADQSKAGLFFSRMDNSNGIINKLENVIINRGIVGGVISGVAGALPNALKSDERQQMEQAQRDFLNAVLRRESGAAIAPTEFASGSQQYFPQPGDSQAVIDQKRKNREIAINGIRNEAGPALQNSGGGLDAAFDQAGFNSAPSKALNGSLSQRFESSGNPGAIGYDSTGGYSYGIYQLAHNNAKTFVEQSPYAGYFQGLTFNSPQWQQRWKQVAAADPQGFAQAQEGYIAKTHLGPQLELLSQKGLRVDSLSPTLQQVILSTAVQHGPNTPIIARAIREVGPNATEQQLITQIYKDRWSGGANFATSTPAVRQAVYNRFFGPNGELATALKMSQQRYA